ncbi:hypothetical protein [Luteimonas sp. A478]
MSSIGSNPHLNLTGLGGLGSQVALDDLQGRQQAGLEHVEAPREPGTAQADVDAGELVLQAAAWEGAGEGTRMLPGDGAFEAALGHLDLSAAADQGVDAIFAALGAA